MVVLVASHRRIASHGDYGFNRSDADNCKQYAKPKATATALSSDNANIDKIDRFSSYFKKIVTNWRDGGEYHVMEDNDFQKAIDLSKLVYDTTSTVPMRTPSTMAGVGSVLAANICSMASAIEEKCAIFLGLPENVSLVKKMITVYTETPDSATLLYRSTLFNKVVSSRKKEKVIANMPSDVLEERFKNHVSRPYRPSLFERFGTTASMEEIGTSNGASTTLSASNTHAKTLVHFTRVACSHMRNSLDVVSGLEEEKEEEERTSVARSLLKEFVSPHLNDDAAILYGNATDRRAFAQVVKNEPLNHGIIPQEFTRDMERTPYVEIDRDSSAITVYSDRFATNEHGNVIKSRKLISLKVNTEQLLCDIIFGSDWDIHLKDYLSLLGYESFFDRDGSLKRRLKRLLLDKRRTDLGDLALVMVSRYIKKVSKAEFDRLLSNDYNDDEPIVPATVADYIRLVVRHIYFDVFYNDGLQNICTRLSENYQTPIETVDGELEEVTGNLFLSRIVDSLHIMRNQDLSRVCYNIDVLVSYKKDDLKIHTASNRVSMQVFDDIPKDMLDVFGGKVGKCDGITICWDATSRRVIAVSKSIKLLDDDNEAAPDTAARNDLLLLNEIDERLKCDIPPSRFFNYRAMHDAVKYVLKKDNSPIPNRFADSFSSSSSSSSNSISTGSNRQAVTTNRKGFFSTLRDTLEAGVLRGTSSDVESMLKAMSDDTKVLATARTEEVTLRDSISAALTAETTARLLIMREDAHGIKAVTFKDSGMSALKTLRDLRNNKIKLSEAMEEFGISTDPLMDKQFAREMELTYPDGAIVRWQKNVDAIRNDLPASQASKLNDIEREIKENKLSGQAVADKINDTELSKAADSILRCSMGGGSKLFVGRFVAIAITGSAIGILGKATADVIHASRGTHYNVYDASSCDLKSFKITRFSLKTAAGTYMCNEDGLYCNAPVCETGLCGRYRSSPVLPGTERYLTFGTSLTCDRGLTVTQAASEVLGTAASKIKGKIIEVATKGAAEVASGVFDLMINSFIFIFGIPVAAGLTFAGLSFINWKRGLSVALAVFVLILCVRFFAGSGFLTIQWFGVDAGDKKKRISVAFMSNYTSTNEETINRLFRSSPIKNIKQRIEEDEYPAGESNKKLKNFEITRPLFGPARPSQEMAYFYVGLLY